MTTREEALARSYDGDLSVLSVGRLDPEKNPLLLADVLARLREHGPALAARGLRRRHHEGRSWPSALRAAGVEDHAELLGYVSLDGGLRELYRNSHVFLHVSWTEGVPQVLFESFAAGLPVVATAVGGVPELAEGRSVLIPPGDADGGHRGHPQGGRRTPSCGRSSWMLGSSACGRFSLDSEAQRVTALFAGNNAAGALAISVIQRQSWVWAVLPEKAAPHRQPRRSRPGRGAARQRLQRAESHAGAHAGTAAWTPCSTTPPACPDARDLADAVAELAEGGVVSIAVAGGRVTPPRAVPTVLRIAAAAALAARDGARARGAPARPSARCEDAGLESTRHRDRRPLAQPLRARARRLGPPAAHAGRLRAHRQPRAHAAEPARRPPSSVLARQRACRSERLSTTVFESGQGRGVPARRRTERSSSCASRPGPSGGRSTPRSTAVSAVAGAERAAGGARPARGPARRRAAVGPLRYSLEPNAVRLPPVAHDRGPLGATASSSWSRSSAWTSAGSAMPVAAELRRAGASA